MRKIRIAQIGISRYSHGWNTFETLKKNTDIFDIAGYVLPENERENFPERMIHFKGYNELSLEEVLNDPEIEAVAVETEEAYLTKYAIMAAKAKKHIHLEKPGSWNLEEFEELIEIVKQNKTVLHLGYMYRYNPIIRDVISEAKNGEFGDIISVDAEMNCPHPIEMRQWLSQIPGGMMFFLGCHLIDLVLQIQSMPKNILPFNKCTGKDGVIAKDFGMAIFEYKNGISAIKTSASEIGGFSRRHLVVTGTKKTTEIRPLEIIAGDDQYTDVTEYVGTDWCNEGTKKRSDLYNRYKDMLCSFARMVAGEMKNPYTYNYELMLYKTILIACK